MYVIDDNDLIHVREGITCIDDAGSEWTDIPGEMVQISLYKQFVAWGIDRNNALWYRRVEIGTNPSTVNPPTNGGGFEIVRNCAKMVETNKD